MAAQAASRSVTRRKTVLSVERPLAEAWVVPLESGGPVRRFTSRKGQRHWSRLGWSATVGGHVGFESTGGSTVGAAGMLQGSVGNKTFDCGSVRSFGICSPEVEFSSMHTFVNFLPGSSLKTG